MNDVRHARKNMLLLSSEQQMEINSNVFDFNSNLSHKRQSSIHSTFDAGDWWFKIRRYYRFLTPNCFAHTQTLIWCWRRLRWCCVPEECVSCVAAIVRRPHADTLCSSKARIRVRLPHLYVCLIWLNRWMSCTQMICVVVVGVARCRWRHQFKTTAKRIVKHVFVYVSVNDSETRIA